MTAIKKNKVFWKPVRFAGSLPSEGLIHVVLDDDQTELVCQASELEAKLSNGLRPLMYACVCDEYKAEFDKGNHRAIDAGYRLTATIVREIEADEKAQA